MTVSLDLNSILELPVMEIQVFTGNTGNREQVKLQIRFPLIPDFIYQDVRNW